MDYHTDAYNAGFKAGKEGRSVDSNPFPSDAVVFSAFYDWDLGWIDGGADTDAGKWDDPRDKEDVRGDYDKVKTCSSSSPNWAGWHGDD